MTNRLGQGCKTISAKLVLKNFCVPPNPRLLVENSISAPAIHFMYLYFYHSKLKFSWQRTIFNKMSTLLRFGTINCLTLQVYHFCHADGKQDTFHCGYGTVFNEYLGTCDYKNNVHCGAGPPAAPYPVAAPHKVAHAPHHAPAPYHEPAYSNFGPFGYNQKMDGQS